MSTPILEVSIILATTVLLLGIMALSLLAQHLNALAFKKSVMKRLADQPLIHLGVDRQTLYTGIAGFTIS
jgi:hypothetical protein